MVRRRSREAESQSVNRRMLLDALIGSDQIENLSVLNRHLRPGLVDRTKIGGGAVEETHLHQDVRDSLGKSTIEHVTLTAVASQSIAAGGATVQWASEGSAPNETRGFETLVSELADGSVGDIPAQLTGERTVVVHLVFDAEYTGTVEIQRTRKTAVQTLELYQGTGDEFYEAVPALDIRSDDVWNVVLDLDSAATLVKGRIAVRDIATGGTASGPVFEGSFDVATGPNGVTWDGTYLWVMATDNVLYAYDRQGSLQDSITPPAPPEGIWQGVVWDGSHFWISNDSSTSRRIQKIDTDGTAVTTHDASSTISPLALGWDSDSSTLWVGFKPDGGGTGRLDIVDTSTGAVTEKWDAPVSGKFIQGLHYAGDGQMWVTVNNSTTAYLVDLSDGSTVRTVEIPGEQASTNSAGTQGVAVVDGVGYVANSEEDKIYVVSGFGGT